jgi:hypothetical protein
MDSPVQVDRVKRKSDQVAVSSELNLRTSVRLVIADCAAGIEQLLYISSVNRNQL